MTQPHEDYAALEPTYAEIDLFTSLNGKSSDITSYGNSIELLLQRDSQLFIEEGMASEYVVSFPTRLNGYSVAAARYAMAVNGETSAPSLWKVSREEATHIKGELMTYGEKAFRNKPALLEKLAEIREGNSNIDLIEDLIEIYELFNEHKELFTPFKKFDEKWLTRAIELHEELQDLNALVKNPEIVIGEAHLRHKQAETHLAEAIDEIRFWGELVYRNDQEKLDMLKFPWKRN